jgi:putative transposase
METGQEPVLSEKVGLPGKSYSEKEAQITRAAHARYRFGAPMLEPVIGKQYKIRISHNRIHIYLKRKDWPMRTRKEQKRRKWVRYELKHSMSARHIDWLE